jgi:quercetin dioxygenase-like cupin family protein
MSYTRRVAEADAVDSGYPHYRVVMAASPEGATVLGCFLGDGGQPPLHIHDHDLFFIVLAGSATLRLGHDVHEAKAGQLIYIPAGLPHGSHNQSGAAERHLEIQVPGVLPGAPILRPVKSVDDAPMPSTAPYVSSVSGEATETIGREKRWALTDESTSERVARVMAVERSGPEPPCTATSRDDDRLIVVAQGQLSTEIAARSAVVAAEAVIFIPAGVPHRIYNSAAAPARYLDADLVASTAYAKLDPGGR